MLYYEVRLIHPETKEVYFFSSSPRPLLPSQEIIDRHQGAVLVVRTTCGQSSQ